MSRRVLFLTVMPSPYQRELFEALHAAGRMKIRVLYCTHDAHDRNWSVPDLNSYEHVLPGKTIAWLSPSAHFNPSIIEILRNDASDLFILSDYSTPTTQIAMRYLTWRKRPWVFWGELPGFRHHRPLPSFVRYRLQRPIASGAAAIAAIGSRAVEAYRMLFPGVPVFNIPYFCNLEPFRAAAAKSDRHTNPAVQVLFSGQLIGRKGVDVLIHAFVKTSRQLPNLHLQLLGTGPAREALIKLIPTDLRDRIHFLGFQQPPALPHIFAAADIFVLPSRHDGWGVVVNEALGAGLPIIVSDRVGASDLVEDGYNGLITSAGDVESLGNALLKLGQSAELRTSFGRGSAERAARWSLDEGTRRWLELYDLTVGEDRR
jgi:glycosyltransferase involved in cell wall biosynthesis